MNPRSLGRSPFQLHRRSSYYYRVPKDRIATVSYFLLRQIEICMLYNTQNTIPCVFKNRLQKLGLPCCCSPNLFLSPVKVQQLICLGQDGMSHTTLTSYPHSFTFKYSQSQSRDISLNLVFKMIPIRLHLLIFCIQDTYSILTWLFYHSLH